VLPIPNEVLKYLKEDFFILPKECAPTGGSSAGASYIGEETNFDDDEDTEGVEIPEFPEFSKQINSTLNKLGKIAGCCDEP
jgi:D123